MKIHQQVEALESRCRSLEHLCNEMVETLTLERNKPHINTELVKCAERWRSEFEVICPERRKVEASGPKPGFDPTEYKLCEVVGLLREAWRVTFSYIAKEKYWNFVWECSPEVSRFARLWHWEAEEFSKEQIVKMLRERFGAK